MVTVNHHLDMARAYLQALDPLSTEFTFQTFPEAPGAPRSLARVFHKKFEDIAPKLVELNQQGAGVFVMLNAGDGIEHDGRATCRTNANVLRVRVAYLDLDGAPVEPVINSPVPPAILIESSPGRYQAIWPVSDCTLEEFGSRQVALARRFGGDESVKDLARVARIPGFYHQKAAPFMSRLLSPVPAPQR
jgi:hypothetical protein